MAKGMTLVGLDVHGRQTHAAVFVPETGELRVRVLRMPPAEVVAFLERLGPGVLAVYEAGPTGFGLVRAAREHGIDVRVAAPGSIPRGSGDRVKTDRRDAVRMVRLLAAGELRFAFVPSVEDEHFRDLVRAIEAVRGDLMRARHRLGKLLLRRGERYPGPGGAWTAKHMSWLHSLRFDDPCSQATFTDYLAAVELLAARRAALIGLLEEQVPATGHAPVIARLRCFRGIDTLSAAGLAAEVGDFRRFPKPSPLAGFLGIVPSERTSDERRRRARSQRPGPATPAGCWWRPPTTTAASRASAPRSPAAGRARTRAWSRSPGAPSGASTSAGSACTASGASPPAWSPSPAPASSPDSSGRPPRLTDEPDHSARGAPGARTSNSKAHDRRARLASVTLGSPRQPAAPDPKTASRDEHRVLR
jgi:transposase